MSASVREEVEKEIKTFLLQKENTNILKKNKGNQTMWYSTSDKSLRFSDLGFDLYSKIHKPFLLELRCIMTSKMLLELDTVLRRKPWYLQRKYKPVQGSSHPPMAYIIHHWSEELNVGWVMAGEDWSTWLTISN